MLKKSVKIGIIISGVVIAIAVFMMFIPVTKNVQTEIANPASKYCIEKGGQSVIETDSNGSQYGICKFPNGSECDEWKYFRGECSPKP